jgi:hypothetical protein
VYRLRVGNPEGKRPLGIQRCRWLDNINMDILDIGVSVVNWIGLAQKRNRWRALVNYRVTAQLAASRVVLSSTELVS